jgi:large subunit ribosomal protein L25
MSEIYEVTAETRNKMGKGENRRIRRLENKFPAVVYGADKAPHSIVLDHNTFVHALENEGFYSNILTLTIDGKQEKVVLKDLHRHPSRPKILHADFLRVSAKTKLTMNIPLHFLGGDTAPGVKAEGGVVSHLMSEVEVRCLPGDLPQYIEVDLSKLAIGDAVHLSNLKLPKGVELTALTHGEGHDQPVANIHKPIVIQEEEPEVSAAAEEAPSSEAAEPSREGEPEA